MTVHEIPGVLRVEWNDSVKAMIDTWSSYTITVPQFREAILEKGVAQAKCIRVEHGSWTPPKLKEPSPKMYRN